MKKTGAGKSEVLLIIPAYNEEKNIERVTEHIRTAYPEYDYVIVNDGSKDDTSRICHARGYNIIDLPVNLGLAGAFQTGMKYAYEKGYDFAIQFDADGQHLVEYVEDILREIKKGYDVIIGSRFVTKKKPFNMRMLGSNMISFAIWLSTGNRIADPTSGMRMFNRKMIREFAVNLNYGPEPDTISYLLKNGARISEVQVKMEERMEGQSYLSAGKAIMYMARMLCSILLIQSFRKKDGR